MADQNVHEHVFFTNGQKNSEIRRQKIHEKKHQNNTQNRAYTVKDQHLKFCDHVLFANEVQIVKIAIIDEREKYTFYSTSKR